MNNIRLHPAFVAAAFALLAVVAVAGWIREPGVRSDARTVYGQPGYALQPGYAAGDPVYPVQGAAANCAEPLEVQNTAYAPQALNPAPMQGAPVYSSANRPRVVRVVERQPATTYVERERVVERPVTRRQRSTAKSAAIVGGSAGVGAAIGALAGGGKGAAIGAISGGAAGFVYDRLTHKR